MLKKVIRYVCCAAVLTTTNPVFKKKTSDDDVSNDVYKLQISKLMSNTTTCFDV